MLDKIETTYYPHDIPLGNEIDLIHTGSTSKTLIGGDYYDDINVKDEKSNKHHEDDGSSQEEEQSIATDEELIAQIEDIELEEKRILKTLDRRMMPLFCIFYFVDFLDRANIGNAR